MGECRPAKLLPGATSPTKRYFFPVTLNALRRARSDPFSSSGTAAPPRAAWRGEHQPSDRGPSRRTHPPSHRRRARDEKSKGSVVARRLVATVHNRRFQGDEHRLTLLARRHPRPRGRTGIGRGIHPRIQPPARSAARTDRERRRSVAAWTGQGPLRPPHEGFRFRRPDLRRSREPHGPPVECDLPPRRRRGRLRVEPRRLGRILVAEKRRLHRPGPR